MSVFTIPEQYVNSSKPIPLFEIDGVEVGVPLLPSDLAETWAEKARKVDRPNLAAAYLAQDLAKVMKVRLKAAPGKRKSLEDEIYRLTDEIRELQAAQHKISKECLDSYPGLDEDTRALLKKATQPQRHFAFELLRAHNDPFVASTSLQQAAQMALLERLNEAGTASKLSTSGSNSNGNEAPTGTEGQPSEGTS